MTGNNQKSDLVREQSDLTKPRGFKCDSKCEEG
jgi:hypothetical protein